MAFRLALRRLRRRWAASTTVVVAGGLSAAVTVGLFAVVDGLVARPLPFPTPERLLAIDYRFLDSRRPPDLAIAPEFAGKRETLRVGLSKSPLLIATAQAGFAFGFFDLEASRDAGLEVTGVDARFFDLLNIRPEVGRGFNADDERSPAATVPDSAVPLPIVLGHELAITEFGDATAALGLHDLAGRRVQIIGVMGPRVKFPGETNVWAPVSSSRDRIPAYARLRSGATVGELSAAFPDLSIRPLGDALRIGSPRALEVLFTASLLLVLLTWAQVSSLVLAAALTELPQLGVMLALGANRATLERQAMLENAIVVVGASVFAATLVPYANGFIAAVIPSEFRRGQYLVPDVRTYAFGVVLALAAFTVLMTVPAFVVARATPLGLLNERIGNSRPGSGRGRQLLLAAQMAATTFLLYLGGLTAHSFARATTFDYGFEPENLLLFTVPVDRGLRNASRQQTLAAFERRNEKVSETIKALNGLPGVTGTSGFYRGPLGTGLVLRFDSPVPLTSFDGRPRPDVDAVVDNVGLDFVQTFQVRVLAGRVDPGESTRPGQILVNRTLAEQLVGVSASEAPAWASVVGRDVRTSIGGGRVAAVIENLVLGPPAAPAIPELFEMDSKAGAFSVIATRVSLPFRPAVDSTLKRIWGSMSPRQIEWMADAWRRAMAPYRSQAILMAILAASGVPIAAVGLIGALVDTVLARRREIAIRLVVGAGQSDIRRIVIRQALVPVGAGLAAGVTTAGLVGVSLQHQLFQVHPVDGVTIISVVAGMLLIAGVGTVIPLIHASRVEPSTLLRSV